MYDAYVVGKTAVGAGIESDVDYSIMSVIPSKPLNPSIIPAAGAASYLLNSMNTTITSDMVYYF